MLDFMSRDCLDLVNQLYESDRIKIHLLRLVSEICSARMSGTAWCSAHAASSIPMVCRNRLAAAASSPRAGALHRELRRRSSMRRRGEQDLTSGGAPPACG